MDIKSLVSVSISDDEMYAYVQLLDGVNHVTLDSGMLLKLLNEAGVKEGINMRELTEISLSPARYIGQKITVAVGEKPVKGEDGKFIYHFEERKQQQEQKKNGQLKIDLKEVTKLDNVSKGELLAEVTLPTEGKPGKSVKGTIVLPQPGKPALLKRGKNVYLSDDDTKLYAEIDGLVSKTESGIINVFPIYEVNGDVDYRIGNIDFNGTVIVRGNVLTGFKITAAGDIRVFGTVDGAHLQAGGSIQVTEGIVGHNKGFIEAKEDVKCSFIQDAHIVAGGDIIATQSIMHSKLSAGKHIGCYSGTGLIVGGILQAGENVRARTIGNMMSTQTTVEVGVLPEIRNEYEQIRQKLIHHKDNVDKTDKALNLLEQMAAVGKLDDSKMALKQKLESTKRHLEQEFEEMNARSADLLAIIENSRYASVEVVQTVYPGTKVVIGRKAKFVKDSVKHVKFILADGDISIISKL